MKEKQSGVLENLVLVAILLVVVHTAVEELALILDWSVSMRDRLVYISFFFDVFFTLEFLIRFFSSSKPWHYVFKERGWLDFLASVPLLILNSGLLVIAMTFYPDYTIETYVAGFGLLKLVKAIRVARIFRLLRVLKVFRKIKNAQSVLAQNHLTRILSTSISTVILGFFLAQGVISFLELPSFERTMKEGFFQRARQMETLLDTGDNQTLLSIAFEDPQLIFIQKENQSVFSRYTNQVFRDHWNSGDIFFVEEGSATFFFSVKELNQEQSVRSLILLLVVLGLVVVFILFYSPYFTQSISDPVYVMRRGFEENDFDYEVAIPNGQEKVDTFRLAKGYNEVYLPQKSRTKAQENNSVLKLGELGNLFSQEEGEEGKR